MSGVHLCFYLFISGLPFSDVSEQNNNLRASTDIMKKKNLLRQRKWMGSACLPFAIISNYAMDFKAARRFFFWYSITRRRVGNKTF